MLKIGPYVMPKLTIGPYMVQFFCENLDPTWCRSCRCRWKPPWEVRTIASRSDQPPQTHPGSSPGMTRVNGVLIKSKHASRNWRLEVSSSPWTRRRQHRRRCTRGRGSSKLRCRRRLWSQTWRRNFSNNSNKTTTITETPTLPGQQQKNKNNNKTWIWCKITRRITKEKQQQQQD